MLTSLTEQERIPYLLGFDPQARAEQSNQTIGALVGRILQVNVTLGGCPFSKSGVSGLEARHFHGFSLGGSY